MTAGQTENAGWQRRLEELLPRFGVVGAQFGLLRLDDDGRPVTRVTASAGLADAEHATPVTLETCFEIGSITKMWTAAVVLQLVAEGRLPLDAPIREVLPEFALQDADAAAHVTMRTLLAHTSGIEGDVFADTGAGDDAITGYVAALRSARLLHPVGARFSYCNAGYVVAGRVVERLLGIRWSDAIDERIIEPLGLAHASADGQGPARRPHAVGHIGGPHGPRAATGRIPPSLAPAGLITANAEDLLAFAAALLPKTSSFGGRSLREGAALFTTQVDLHDVQVTTTGWGLGAMCEDWGGADAWGHDGATLGQRAFLRMIPDHHLAAVLLTTGGRPDGLFRALFAQVAERHPGLALPAPLTATGRAPAPARAYGFDDVGAIVSNDADGALLTLIDPSPTGGAPQRSTIELHGSTTPGVWAWTTPDLDGWAAFRPVDAGAYLGLRFLPAV
ncbi:beta-lactamase family protein [Microbacterium sp. KUDC0406]|uniref:serine hydrolase domain-containing protein n=1 Tax=Microbacterium sp. KUDC0406 TaxID=2909588 RepID=UPI001F2953D5|nr:serine hydrolase domain-containing protein [Microbacterium sp. KUDC0406]UJP10855.1 beta-lactamase family protein [Microbacterium sp. KUDC0406]